MAQRTAARLGHGLTKEAVRSDVSVAAKGESNIVEVSATAPSAALAASIANTYARVFVSEQAGSNQRYYATALKLVERQLAGMTRAERAGTAGLALQARAQSLAILSELRNSSVRIAQAATPPTSASSPRVLRNTGLAALIGLIFGLGVALLLDARRDRSAGTRRDLPSAPPGAPVLEHFTAGSPRRRPLEMGAMVAPRRAPRPAFLGHRHRTRCPPLRHWPARMTRPGRRCRTPHRAIRRRPFTSSARCAG